MIIGKCPTTAAGHERAQNRREPIAEPASASSDAAAGTALISLEMGKFRPAASRPNRPDAVFVTHLIATVQQAPQTRTYRRASTADAMSHYHAMTRIASPYKTVAAARVSRTA